MTKRKKRRRRTTSEKVMLVLGVLIALAMIFGLIVGLGGGRSSGQAPLTYDWAEYDLESAIEGYISVDGPAESESDVELLEPALQNAALQKASD